MLFAEKQLLQENVLSMHDGSRTKKSAMHFKTIKCGLKLEVASLIAIRLMHVAVSSCAPGLGFGQPSATQGLLRNAGEVRLDIEDGCAVKHVHAPHVELYAFVADKLHHREPDRIGTPRRARGEHTMRTIVGGWTGCEIEP